MKKSILFLLILVVLFIPLNTAYAEYEPVPDTPYGIPLYDSPEDVDLATVFAGNSLGRIIDLVDNIKIEQVYDSIVSGNQNSGTKDVYYFRETEAAGHEGQLVEYNVATIESSGGIKTGGIKTESLRALDIEDPFMHSLASNGALNKQELSVETVTKLLEKPVLGFSLTEYTFKITHCEIRDGLYYIEFDADPIETDPSVIYSKCSVLIDPETSLLCGVSYHNINPSCSIENETTATISYGISSDEIPDHQKLF